MGVPLLIKQAGVRIFHMLYFFYVGTGLLTTFLYLIVIYYMIKTNYDRLATTLLISLVVLILAFSLNFLLIDTIAYAEDESYYSIVEGQSLKVCSGSFNADMGTAYKYLPKRETSTIRLFVSPSNLDLIIKKDTVIFSELLEKKAHFTMSQMLSERAQLLYYIVKQDMLFNSTEIAMAQTELTRKASQLFTSLVLNTDKLVKSMEVEEILNPAYQFGLKEGNYFLILDGKANDLYF
jgi:hypothetical protein